MIACTVVYDAGMLVALLRDSSAARLLSGDRHLGPPAGRDQRGPTSMAKFLGCHSDRGSQYTSIRYTDRLVEAGAKPSVGSVGNSYDNALAESVNGLYKTELIHRKGPWRTADDVELATFEWVDWYNNRRIHSSCQNMPPADFEALFYLQDEADIVAEA